MIGANHSPTRPHKNPGGAWALGGNPQTVGGLRNANSIIIELDHHCAVDAYRRQTRDTHAHAHTQTHTPVLHRGRIRGGAFELVQVAGEVELQHDVAQTPTLVGGHPLRDCALQQRSEKPVVVLHPVRADGFNGFDVARGRVAPCLVPGLPVGPLAVFTAVPSAAGIDCGVIAATAPPPPPTPPTTPTNAIATIAGNNTTRRLGKRIECSSRILQKREKQASPKAAWLRSW